MLSDADRGMMQAALDGSNPLVGPGLLPDRVDIEDRTEQSRSAAGVVYTYATATGGYNVACRFDPAERIERLQNGVRTVVTEWPVCFRYDTAPAVGQVVHADARYLVVARDTVSSWSGLTAVRVQRLEAA